MTNHSTSLITASIISTFLKWFFTEAPADILRIGKNFLLWGWKFFSIGFFVRYLFAPWHRDITGYGRGFDLRRWLHVFGWNFISRFIGAAMRIFVMAVGLLVEAIIGLVVLGIFVLWFAFPIIIVGLLLMGLTSLLFLK